MKRIPRTDAIVFDFDGVLAESVHVKTKAFAALYAEFGPAIVEKVVEYHLAHGGVSRFAKFRYYHEALLGQSLSAEHERQLGDRFSRFVKEAVISAPYVDGAHEFLIEYHQQVKLFVASGTPDEELAEIIDRRAMRQFFVSVHGTPARKAEIIAGILGRHNLKAERVLVVGDAMADLEGAQANGTRFLARVTDDEVAFPAYLDKVRDLKSLADYI